MRKPLRTYRRGQRYVHHFRLTKRQPPRITLRACRTYRCGHQYVFIKWPIHENLKKPVTRSVFGTIVWYPETMQTSCNNWSQILQTITCLFMKRETIFPKPLSATKKPEATISSMSSKITKVRHDYSGTLHSVVQPFLTSCFRHVKLNTSQNLITYTIRNQHDDRYF